MPQARPIQRQQTLREVFDREPGEPTSAIAEPVLISLGTLALSLGCGLARLLPLAEHGFLRLRSAPPLSSKSFVEAPGEAAVTWLRGWLQPAQAKPLWAAADIAEILELDSAAQVLTLAAEYNIPLTWEPGLGGHALSCWAARHLVLAVGRSRAGSAAAARWDRQALLAMLLEGDPDAVLKPPPISYLEALEQEIERVAGLAEPQRSIRAAALLQQFEDAKRVATAGSVEQSWNNRGGRGTSVEQSSVPGSGAAASMHTHEPFEQAFLRLRRAVARPGRSHHEGPPRASGAE